MGGRHKNFEDPMLYELRNRGNKVLKLYIFYGPPFTLKFKPLNKDAVLVCPPSFLVLGTNLHDSL